MKKPFAYSSGFLQAGAVETNQPSCRQFFFAWRSACVLLCVMRRVGASCWHAKSPSHLSLFQTSKTPKKKIEGENESRVPSAGPAEDGNERSSVGSTKQY